ncbi:hypothetical protein F6455_02250 [Proteobacteria bacterium 005FR1]|nr:hypothetical protein [Proteobacteria bacterium 005FR1]
MRRSFLLGSAGVVGAALLATASLITPVQAESYKVPKNEFGQPDISGFWSNSSLTPLTRPKELGDQLVYTPEQVAKIEGEAETLMEEGNRPTDPDAPAEFEHESSVTRPEFEAAGGDVGGYNTFWLDPGNHIMRVNGEPRTSILTTKNGQVPTPKRRPEPDPRKQVDSYTSYETRSLGERCIIGFGRNGGPPMFANGFYNNNYQIVQAPEHVMILVEMNHDARIVRLNTKQHLHEDVRPWFGDSIGWYEGNTLVVETTNLPKEQAFIGSWENLKVTERFTRVGEHRLHYKFTVEDPTMWDKPWGGEYEFSPLDGVIYEYACHEGNYSLPGILQGARVEEAKGKKK